MDKQVTSGYGGEAPVASVADEQPACVRAKEGMAGTPVNERGQPGHSMAW